MNQMRFAQKARLCIAILTKPAFDIARRGATSTLQGGLIVIGIGHDYRPVRNGHYGNGETQSDTPDWHIRIHRNARPVRPLEWSDL